MDSHLTKNRRSLEHEIDEEIEFHLDMVARELTEDGMEPERAREEAERRFGDRQRHRSSCREIQARSLRGDRRRSLLRDLRGDVAFGLRELTRSPGNTLVAVVALAFAIGASTLVFSLVSGILLDPLAFPDSDRVLALWERDRESGALNDASPANFVDWREQSADAFQAMSAYTWRRYALTGLGEPTVEVAATVSEDFFRVTGIGPRLGRTFVAEELERGGPPAVIVGDAFWRRRLGATPDVLERSLELDGRTTPIVGVMPPGFGFPDVDLWTPLVFDFDLEGSRGAHYLNVVARLAPDVDLEAATTRLDHVAEGLEAAHPERNAGAGIRALPLHQDLVGSARRPLQILLAAVGLVLLIAILDVAGLQLVRGWARQKELAVRGALGATSGRLARQLVTESLLLAVLGGALGVALATLGLQPFLRLLPRDLPRTDDVAIDGQVLLFSLGAVLVAGLASGLWPALRTTRRPTTAVLRASSDRSRHLARRGLVVVEVALAVVLVAASGLLWRSLSRTLDIDPGFDPRGKLTFRVDLPEQRYPDNAAHPEIFERMRAGLEALPGVTSVGMSPWLPLDPGWVFSFEIPGEPEPPPGKQPVASLRFVNADYFATLGIPLLDGRAFSDRDRPGAENVVVINQTLARRHFPDGSPIGRRIVVGYGNPDEGDIERTVVGVVGDVRQYRLTRGAMPAVYVPHRQVPFDVMSFAVAVDGDPSSLADEAAAVIHSVDPDLVVDRVEPMTARVWRAVGQQRFALELFGVFALLALLLALLGLYAVLAQTVAQQRREIGVRMALGAERGRVARSFLVRGLALAALGVLLGLGAALAATRLLEAQLFETSTRDAIAFATAPALVLAAAALASWVPARRATRVDPTRALRPQ